MKDPRCLVGLHDFSPYEPDPPVQTTQGELPGAHLRCPRCLTTKYVRVDESSYPTGRPPLRDRYDIDGPLGGF
jgi:hypothetical protein